MEDVVQRFPLISRQIFENLDNESLLLCRKVCKAWKNCIDSEKFYWIRIFMKFLQYSEEKSLRILFHNSNLDTVKNLALTIIEHCHSEYSPKDITLLHIIAANGDAGNLKILEKILHGNGISKKLTIDLRSVSDGWAIAHPVLGTIEGTA